MKVAESQRKRAFAFEPLLMYCLSAGCADREPSLDTNSLYRAFRSGNGAVREQLFQILGESFRLFVQQKVGGKDDAEELVQDALTTVAEKIDSVEIEVSFAAWSYGVLENKLLNYYRHKKTQRDRFVQLSDDDRSGSSQHPDPDLKLRLLNCLKKISEDNIRRARVLNLHYQGYSVDEICERFELSRNGVYVLLSRARSLLKTCLEKGDIR